MRKSNNAGGKPLQ